MNRADHLYIMCNTLIPQVYKIGRAADAQKRANQLMMSQPFRIKVIMTFPEMGFLERGLHKSLESFRVKSGPGVEWFKCDLSLIVTRVLQRLPAYIGNLVAEAGRHTVENTEAAFVTPSKSSDTSDLSGGSLCTDGMSPISYVSARASLATDLSRDPVQVVPDSSQLPILGEVALSVLAVGDEADRDVPHNFSARQQSTADVLKCPAAGLEVSNNLERFRYQSISAIEVPGSLGSGSGPRIHGTRRGGPHNIKLPRGILHVVPCEDVGGVGGIGSLIDVQ